MGSANARINDLCEAMREECGAGIEFELELGELVGKYRRQHHRRQQCIEAARLLPSKGADGVAEKQGCHRSTGYRRARKAKLVAFFFPRATNA